MLHRGLVALVLALVLVGCSHHAPQQSGNSLDDSVPAPSTASASRGASLFVKNCAVCHASTGIPSPIGPSLRLERERKTAAAITLVVEHPDPPMPKLFPGTLSAQDVADIVAYVETL